MAHDSRVKKIAIAACGICAIVPACALPSAWPELDLVSESAGGAPLAQRDALKLLAAMLLHVDSKAVQQRLICDGERNRGASLAKWSASAVWKDAGRCVANVTPGNHGTLRDPVISEAGRASSRGSSIACRRNRRATCSRLHASTGKRTRATPLTAGR